MQGDGDAGVFFMLPFHKAIADWRMQRHFAGRLDAQLYARCVFLPEEEEQSAAMEEEMKRCAEEYDNINEHDVGDSCKRRRP